MLTLLLLACAPDDPTPEARADALYDACVTLYEAWGDCTPETPSGYTPEENCAGYVLLECDP